MSVCVCECVYESECVSVGMYVSVRAYACLYVWYLRKELHDIY